ncbi:hypothetical protein [Paraburkholderia sediminicola]|uniref:hypothetical protein n=1 Tax=Paraburkholderia sediminicola TaxID=458836 RepID=UPI0038B7D7D7
MSKHTRSGLRVTSVMARLGSRKVSRSKPFIRALRLADHGDLMANRSVYQFVFAFASEGMIMDLDRLIADCLRAIYAGQVGPPHSGYLPKTHYDFAERVGPGSGPWRTSEAAYGIVSALGLKVAAAGLENSGQRGTVEHRLDTQIAQIIDEVCGTPNPHIHIPLPGPSPFGFALAAELSLISASVHEGSLRDAVATAASMALQRAIGPATS